MYNNMDADCYFWRTTQQQEIDYIEELNGELRAYKFKWKAKSKARLSRTFEKAYPVAEYKVITPKNFEELIM